MRTIRQIIKNTFELKTLLTVFNGLNSSFLFCNYLVITIKKIVIKGSFPFFRFLTFFSMRDRYENAGYQRPKVGNQKNRKEKLGS